jgi:pimeloyl-ACP methyl ester carboxylesterase
MGELHLITKDCEEPQNGSVIFVHGLGGDPFGTWRHSKDEDAFWPAWLAEDVKQARVYSFGYDAAPSAWLGSSMTIFDRAKQLLAWLETIPDGPIIFVCHSLGGLIVKKALQRAESSGRNAWHRLAVRTKGIAFFATPHTGSDLSGIMMRLGKLFRLTVTVKELERNVPQLRELNEWYRDNAIRLGISTISFYETQRISGFLVVDESSADPGIAGAAPIPLDADHVSIVKPQTRSALQHVSLKSSVAQWLAAGGPLDPSTKERRPEDAKHGLKPSRIFISYKRGVVPDEQLARAISEGMRAAGHDVFVDVEMKIGVDWAAEIERRITECDYLIILLSEAAVTSEMVQAEVRLAHQSRKSNSKPVILPVRVANDGSLDYELDAFLGRIQFLSWKTDHDTEHIITCLGDRIAEGQPLHITPSPSLDQLALPDEAYAASSASRPTSSTDAGALLGLRQPGGSLIDPAQ